MDTLFKKSGSESDTDIISDSDEMTDSESSRIKTYLSGEIRSLLIPRCLGDCSNFSLNSHNYVEGNLLLNWCGISNVIQRSDLENPTFSYEFCLNVVDKLQPVWNEIEKCGRHTTTLENLAWIGCGQEVVFDFNVKEEYTTKYLENILFLTSVIEHGLGDVYTTITSKPPPHLLRDLIASKELKQLFGDLQIFFLQILIGHPNGINLRNIVWHGFPSVEEIAPYYYFTLLSIVTSYGLILEHRFFKVKSRALFFESVSLLDQIELNAVFNISDFKICLGNSKHIGSCHYAIWDQIIQYYNTKNFRSGILLLLPQIEMTMRLIFSDLNGIDITAKLNEYYFIMDTILEEYLDSSNTVKNQIFIKLDKSILKLIYDLFQSQTGPRLRDKISHGDLLTSHLNFKAFEKLLVFFYNLINFNNINYEILFHPNRVLINKFEILHRLSDDVSAINIPVELFQNNKVLYLNLINFEINDFANLKVFYRLKLENEIISLLNKIVDNSIIALNNLINNLNIRIDLFSKFQLHSKRRETLKKFISNLDVVLNDGIYKINNLIIIFFSKIHNNNCLAEMNEKQVQVVIKFLKKLLKFSENVAKYLHIDQNQWLQSIKLTQDINKIFSSDPNLSVLLE